MAENGGIASSHNNDPERKSSLLNGKSHRGQTYDDHKSGKGGLRRLEHKPLKETFQRPFFTALVEMD